MQKNRFLPIWIFIVIAIVAAGGAVVAVKRPRPIPHASPQANTTPLTNDTLYEPTWKIYKDSSRGFSLSYPSQLRVENLNLFGKDLLHFYSAVNLDNKIPVLIVGFEDIISPSLSLDSYIQQLYQVTGDKIQEIVTGGKTAKIITVVNPLDPSIKAAFAYIPLNPQIIGNDLYMYINRPGISSELSEEEFIQIISSFSFFEAIIPPPPPSLP